MQLGSSLSRRRGGGGKRRNSATSAPPRRKRRRRRRDGESGAGGATWLKLLAAGVGGGLSGYLVATLVFFPAPPPPEELTEVPNLRGREAGLALALLEDVGLGVRTFEYLNHPQADSGSVLGQSPLPGQLAIPGDSIRLTLSLGPERRTVPEIARLRGDRAVALLQATGFDVRVDSVESREPRGRILSVVPGEGEELTLPGRVAVRVSLGPPAVTMPDLLRLSEDQARDTLNALGLNVSEVEEVFRFGRDQGRVVAQDPPPGEELERGTPVRLVVGRRSRR